MIFTTLDRIIGFINRNIAAFGISGGVALAFGNVVARYVFDSSLTWASELTTYLFLWSVFFGAAYCFKQDAHIGVSIMLEKVNPVTAKILMIVSHTITLLFLLAVGYYGYEYVIFVHELEEMSVDLEMPMWIVYLVIPVSFFFAAYRVGEKLYEVIMTAPENVLKKSEAEMIVQQMAEGENEELLKEVEKKTGSLL
ncbi:MAG: TRAP transporter small permease [Campylobacterales bacterium]|nr:TRAP transporter small permease [Campylobacterales bacterium]